MWSSLIDLIQQRPDPAYFEFLDKLRGLCKIFAVNNEADLYANFEAELNEGPGSH